MLPSDPNSFNARVPWYDAEHGVWLDPPTVGMRHGRYRLRPCTTTAGADGCACAAAAEDGWMHVDDLFASARRTTPLAVAYRACIERQLRAALPRLGACLLEVRPALPNVGTHTCFD
jgi:hypothetical protein